MAWAFGLALGDGFGELFAVGADTGAAATDPAMLIAIAAADTDANLRFND